MAKSLNGISKKIGILEKKYRIRIESESEKYEREREERFLKYSILRREKLVRIGGNPELERLDYFESTTEEFEYRVSQELNNELSPEERYQKRKKLSYHGKVFFKENGRVGFEGYGCTKEQCVIACPYYKDTGRVNDNQVIEELFRNTKIVDVDDYRKELGNEIVDSIMDHNYFVPTDRLSK
jgi:hypothetical protein